MADEYSTADCESLIEDLALGLCSTCPLTPEQELLSIPWPMVYLSGLILCRSDERNGGTPSQCHLPAEHVSVVPDSAHEQLRHYCEIYNRCLGRKGQPLQIVAMMSPRVRPSKEQQLVIQKDVTNKAKAKALLQALLETQKEETTKENTTPQPHGVCKSRKKKNSKTKPKQMQSTTSTVGGNEVQPSSTNAAKPESLEEVIRIHLNTTHATDQDHDSPSNDWIDVPSLTRTATRANYSPVQAPLPVDKDDPKLEHRSHCQNTHNEDTTHSTFQEYTPILPIEPQYSCSVNSYLAAARAGRPIETATSISSDSQIPQLVVQQSHQTITKHPTTETDQSEHAMGKLEIMRRRIEELEQALEESNRLLLDERQQHTNALKEERERHVNSMQALQLRLYISETRLKTYQDALEEHIHSVAENVYHPNASPPRRLSQEKDRKSPPPASPLMSRVLHKSNRLDESF